MFGLESCDDSLVKEPWECGGSVWQTLNLCIWIGHTKILLMVCGFIKHKDRLHRSNQSLTALHSPSLQHHWLTTICLSHLPDMHTIPLHLFEKWVIMTYTGNSILSGALSIVSYYLVFIFLDEMNHQFIYIIVQSNHSYAHSPVQPMQYLHFLWNMTFLLCLSSSSACTSQSVQDLLTHDDNNCF